MSKTVSLTGDVTHAERERLGKLSEELGEAQQVIGKIMIHGFVAADGDRIYDNRKPSPAECAIRRIKSLLISRHALIKP